MNEVTLELKWERTEFIRAVQRGYRPNWLDVVLVVLVSLIGAGTHGQTLLYAVVGITAVAFLHYVLEPRMVWNRLADVDSIRKITVSDVGIEITSPSQYVKIPWTKVKRTRETAHYYFVEIERRGVASPFRKNSFKSAADEFLFRKLLTQHSKTSIKMTSPLDALAG